MDDNKKVPCPEGEHSFEDVITEGKKTTKCWKCDFVKSEEKVETVKCPACEEFVTVEDWENEGGYSNTQDMQICRGCYENDQEYPSTIIKFENGEKEIVRWGDLTANSEDGDEPPSWFWDIFDGRKWVSSGGYRGYQETSWKGGLVKLTDGWVTGWPDSSISHKKKTFDLQDLLEKGKTPAPLFWVFEPTSNVFSTASEVLCYEADKEKITKWLDKHGFTEEDLDIAFG